jgi:methylglutaconyl-CoA hydratase/polyketide biosynthesis enoyl-CoA hydratase PksH
VELNVQNGVAWITLNSPENGNALNYAVGREIAGFVAQASSDAACRAIVIRSACEDFCRGMDFDSVIKLDGDLRLLSSSFAETLALIARSPKPVIACVDGKAIGGGAGLVSACDIVIASPASMFSLPEVIVGMIPALILPYLQRRMSPGRVRYLAMSSRAIGAEEARIYGLVDEVAENVDDAVSAQLKRIFRSAPHAVAETKKYFEVLADGEWLRQEKTSADQLNAWLSRDAVMTGVRAFAEGFAPPWFEKYGARTNG